MAHDDVEEPKGANDAVPVEGEESATTKTANRYTRILERVFFNHYKEGDTIVDFDRSEFDSIAQELGIERPKNLGDILYSFRHRAQLPASIIEKQPEGKVWLIFGRGRALYRFRLFTNRPIVPSPNKAETRIPDATPGVIAKYALSDEQALLAKLRYNRLIDVFTGVTCYSLQNHLRTQVPDIGQVETDEIYVGVDRRGAHYVFPVQAKGGKDTQSPVQIWQDFRLCRHKFPSLICRPIAAQFMREGVIAMFDFEETDDDEMRNVREMHYRLVPFSEMTNEELERYRQRGEDF